MKVVRMKDVGPDVAAYGEGLKRLHHDELGLIELEFSAFAVDGRPELGMVVYNPATDMIANRIRQHLFGTRKPESERQLRGEA